MPFLGIYLKKCKSTYKRDTCIPMLITALFTIAKLWNQLRSLANDKRIEKMWYIYTMKYYSTIKHDEIIPFVGKWMELEIIMLNEIS
jgi:hypothetical protein